MDEKRKTALAGAAWAYSTFHNNVSSERLQRVTPRNRCPICQHPGWCLISPDGVIVGCMREDRGAFRTVQTEVGSMFLHRLREDGQSLRRIPPLERRSKPRPIIATADHRHAVYTAFLERLTLSAEHATALRDHRKLSEETVTRNLYATAPPMEPLVRCVERLADEFEASSIPGFFRECASWRCAAKPGELLIPARDHRERIAAVLRGTGGVPKYVWMSNAARGASCGTPLHFALPYMVRLQGHMIITEGLLKADSIAEALHVAVCAIPGAGCFGVGLAADLTEWFPELRSVSVAFDSDESSNPHVRAALTRLVRILLFGGFAVDVLRWSPCMGKGLDDVLHADSRRGAA